MTATAPVPSSPGFVARTPVDLIALVPVVLGFHPCDSVVLLTFGPPGGSFHARVDLPSSSEAQVEVADLLVEAVLANGVRRAALVLFTDDVGAADAQAGEVVARLLEAGCDVVEVVRVDEGRWFPVPDDGSAGTAYDLQTHPFTARHVFDGQVVHRDREALADSLVGTDDVDENAVAMSATRFADRMLARHPGEAMLAEEATWVQRRVRQRVADGLRLGAADAGRMLVLASLVPTRDVAWAEISRPSAAAHVELWRDLVRRAPRDLLPGAASLLAFAAWQRGDGALAWCAIDRALEVDPDYSMAHLVADALTRAIPPDAWEPMDPSALPVFEEPVVEQPVVRHRAPRGGGAGQAADRAS